MQNEPIFLKRKNTFRKAKEKRSTGPSRVVPHRSTTPARTSLTSLFGWEAVSLVDMAALARVSTSLYMNHQDTSGTSLSVARVRVRSVPPRVGNAPSTHTGATSTWS